MISAGFEKANCAIKSIWFFGHSLDRAADRTASRYIHWKVQFCSSTNSCPLRLHICSIFSTKPLTKKKTKGSVSGTNLLSLSNIAEAKRREVECFLAEVLVAYHIAPVIHIGYGSLQDFSETTCPLSLHWQPDRTVVSTSNAYSRHSLLSKTVRRYQTQQGLIA